MDPKRKKIYLIVIAVCLILSAGLLFMNFSSSTSNNIPEHVNPGTSQADQTTDEARGNATIGFQAPPVFPNSKEFNTSVLNSPAFKKLKPFQPVDVSGQLGRPNPFNTY